MTRTRVKICGLTRRQDVEAAARLGADAIGFVLWPRSPRAVRPEAVAALTAGVAPFITRVGVFVNATPEEVATAVALAGLDAVQLHGDENVAAYAGVGARVIKSVTLDDDAAMARALGLAPEVTPIADAADRERRGGTGAMTDWTRAGVVARRRRLILAGGLAPDNAGRAIAGVRPYALDVSSGVEASPGVKSLERLEAFFAAVVAADAEGA